MYDDNVSKRFGEIMSSNEWTVCNKIIKTFHTIKPNAEKHHSI